MKTIRLTADEQNELATSYAQLDAEWCAAGKAKSPERMPFEREDIIEWRKLKLTADEPIKGLRAYAWASDRINAARARAMQQTDPPKVLNKKQLRGSVPNSVYIGRPSMWGNPFVLGKDGKRADLIAKYETWLAQQPYLLAQLDRLRGRHLVCWCAPQPCHGDVLLRRANAPTLHCS
jgi:hypothetical protein